MKIVKEQLGKVNKKLELPIHIERQEHLVRSYMIACQNMPDLPHNIYNLKRGKHKLVSIKLPDKYRADYIITTDYGKMIAVVECKWYFTSWHMNNGIVKLSLMKIKDTIELADLTGCRPVFIVRLNDGFYYWIPSRDFVSTSTMEIAGRTDRGYKGDIEPMISVPERYWYPYYQGESKI